MLELNDLIIEAIDSRLWARQGVRLALARHELEVADDDDERIARIRGSAQRALDHWNAMTLVTI